MFPRRPQIEHLEARRLLSTGALDTSFNGTGYVLGPAAASGNTPFFGTGEALAELSDGQTLVAGQVAIGDVNGIYVRRYNSDGTVDTSFGSGDGYAGASGYTYIGGSLFPDPLAGSYDPNDPAVARITIDSSGDILVAEADAGIVRLMSSGAVDDSFGSGGFSSVSGLADVAVVSNSDIVATNYSGTIKRLTSSGTIDDTFGTSGTLTLPVSPGEYNGNLSGTEVPQQLPIAIQQDGDILVGGADSAGDMAIVRLTSAGVIDTTFGTNGLASVSFNNFYTNSDNSDEYISSQASALAVLANGDIVAGGLAYLPGFYEAPEDAVAAEFLPSGELNTAFGDGGQIAPINTSGTSITFTGDTVAAVLPQSNGELVFAGSTFDSGNPYDGNEGSFFLVGARASGALDNSFGNAGVVTTQFSSTQANNDGPLDIMYCAANTPDGKVVVVGDAAPIYQALNSTFVLASYIVQPVPTVTIADASAQQGQDVQFTATLSSELTSAVTANYSLAPRTAPAADFDTDAGTVTIAAGSTTATIDVPTYGDSNGSNEEFAITLASLSSDADFANGQTTESATGSIIATTPVLIASVTSLQSSSSDISLGNSLTLTAHVNGSSATPTGTVTFLNDGTDIGASALDSSGDASLLTSQLSVGANSITATYGGNSSYQTSTSSPVIVTVATPITSTPPQATLTSLNASSATLVVGQSDTLTVGVTSAGGTGPVPTGDVTLFEDGTALGTYPLPASGVLTETYAVSSSSAASTQFNASYSGNSTYLASASSPVVVTVNPLQASIIDLTTPATILVVGQSDTLTVDVASAAGSGSVPTGNVTIFQDGVARGTYALPADGILSETYTVSSPAASTQFTASYSGDADDAASSSNAVAQSYLPASFVASSVSKAVIPAAGIAGQTFYARLPIRVENNGALLKGKFTIALYLDEASEGLDGKQIEVKATTENVAMKLGKAMTVSFALKSLPASLTPGQYHFVTEITDPIGDSSITTSTQTVTVTAPFVLLFATAGQITPATIQPGRTGYLIISIKNTGNMQAHGILNIIVTGTDPNTGESELSLATLIQPTDIKPTSTKRYRLRIVIPKTVSKELMNAVANIELSGATATANEIDAITIG